MVITGQCGRDLLQQIQIGTHSAFCSSGTLPITANTTAQMLACVFTSLLPRAVILWANFPWALRCAGSELHGGAWPPFITACSSSFTIVIGFFVMLCPLAAVAHKFPRLWDIEGILILIFPRVNNLILWTTILAHMLTLADIRHTIGSYSPIVDITAYGMFFLPLVGDFM